MASSGARRSELTLLTAAIVAGIVVGAGITPFLGIAAGLVAGWAALGLVSVIWTVANIWPMDALQTRTHATAEDPGRAMARLVSVIGGSIASLGAVAIVLVQTGAMSELRSYVLAAIAVVNVAASWALIQINYTLRIAGIYYSEPQGGIDFNSD